MGAIGLGGGAVKTGIGVATAAFAAATALSVQRLLERAALEQFPNQEPLRISSRTTCIRLDIQVQNFQGKYVRR